MLVFGKRIIQWNPVFFFEGFCYSFNQKKKFIKKNPIIAKENASFWKKNFPMKNVLGVIFINNVIFNKT